MMAVKFPEESGQVYNPAGSIMLACTYSGRQIEPKRSDSGCKSYRRQIRLRRDLNQPPQLIRLYAQHLSTDTNP